MAAPSALEFLGLREARVFAEIDLRGKVRAVANRQHSQIVRFGIWRCGRQNAHHVVCRGFGEFADNRAGLVRCPSRTQVVEDSRGGLLTRTRLSGDCFVE